MDFKYHLITAWNYNLKYIAPLILMTLALAGVSFLTLGILAPVTMAGYMQSILELLRDGREPKVKDIFSQMRLFLPLLAFGVAAFVVTFIGLMLLVLPGLLVILGISFFCLYMIPLMTDKNLGIVEAVKVSAQTVLKSNLADHVVVLVIFMGLSAIGGSVFIGFLFTQPLATLFLLSIYDELLGRGEVVSPTPPGPPPAV